MQKATKLLQKIKETMEADQGASYRENLGLIMPKMTDAYEGEHLPFRTHLGASSIGKECTRQLWYQYRWTTPPRFPDRILRLFNRGHLEEARFLAMLAAIGCSLWYETPAGGQMKLEHFEGHFGSAIDGIGIGIPDEPKVAMLLEFKTASNKSFQKTKLNGVEMDKPEHYVQMQIYMHFYELRKSLYMVVNKNNDDLHAEIIEYDRALVLKYLERAGQIIFSDEGFPKISESPGWWKCKFCGQRPVCHGVKLPAINCRTCVHSTAAADGSWSCNRDHPEIDNKEESMKGCEDHVYNPFMLNNVFYHGGNEEKNCIDITLPNGSRILHGPNNVTSQELQTKGLG